MGAATLSGVRFLRLSSWLLKVREIRVPIWRGRRRRIHVSRARDLAGQFRKAGAAAQQHEGQ